MTTNSIYDLIPQYGAHKEELDAIKKVCDRENKDIKALMKQDNITVLESGGYIAQYSVQQRGSINEDMMLDILKELGTKAYDLNIIKTAEYVDYDALEKAIYHGEIEESVVLDMDRAKEVKEVTTLRISKVKEKK